MHEIDRILENMVVTQYMRDQNLSWITYKNRGEGINGDVLIHAACAYPNHKRYGWSAVCALKWIKTKNSTLILRIEFYIKMSYFSNPCMNGANPEQKAKNVLENTRWPHSRIFDCKYDWSILRKIRRGLASNHVVMDGNREFNDNF